MWEICEEFCSHTPSSRRPLKLYDWLPFMEHVLSTPLHFICTQSCEVGAIIILTYRRN